jgi:hypothetical protein
MKLPVINGLIDRRLLVNYNADPAAVQRLLPSPFRPHLQKGRAVAGICLIRLVGLRPRWVPRFLGARSEGAAHRIAVEWEDDGHLKTGVFIPRRDTSSWLNAGLGGRLFPGVHHHAAFRVRETDSEYSVRVDSPDDGTSIHVEARVAARLPSTSVFRSLNEASAFFEGGSLGYSPSASGDTCDGLELRTSHWQMQPLDVSRVRSSFFESPDLFPEGSISFDCGLLMRHIPHEWHALPAKSYGVEGAVQQTAGLPQPCQSEVAPTELSAAEGLSWTQARDLRLGVLEK